MAKFKVAKRQYIQEDEVERVISYVIKYSKNFFTLNLYDINNSLYLNQILYLQNCAGKKLHSRIRHFMLTFDSWGWEWEIGEQEIRWFMDYFIKTNFIDYQVICGIHKGNGGWHAHILVNPVNIKNHKLLYWSQSEYQNFLWELAFDLYMKLGVALQGVGYIDADGKFRRGCNEICLYLNRYNKSVPLKNADGSVVVMPYMNGMYVIK